MTSPTTIYAARKIITMNPARPETIHVAVRDDRILGAGSLDELRGWGVHELDARFADMVLMPPTRTAITWPVRPPSTRC